MSGTPIAVACTPVAPATTCTGSFARVTIVSQASPYPQGKLSVVVFEDDFPLSGAVAASRFWRRTVQVWGASNSISGTTWATTATSPDRVDQASRPGSGQPLCRGSCESCRRSCVRLV
jgi:hypothetical protein